MVIFFCILGTFLVCICYMLNYFLFPPVLMSKSIIPTDQSWWQWGGHNEQQFQRGKQKGVPHRYPQAGAGHLCPPGLLQAAVLCPQRSLETFQVSWVEEYIFYIYYIILYIYMSGCFLSVFSLFVFCSWWITEVTYIIIIVPFSINTLYFKCLSDLILQGFCFW